MREAAGTGRAAFGFGLLPALVLALGASCSSGASPSKDAGQGAGGTLGGGAADAGAKPTSDAGAARDASTASDANSVADGGKGSASDAGAFAVPGLEHSVAPGAPISTKAGEWSYVPFDDAVCANGSTTGIAVNPVAHAKGLVIFLQGGGACWDANSCLVANTSIHLHEDVKDAIVLPEAKNLGGVFDRTNALNPFRDYAYVYSAYCTGDLHAGTTIATYTGTSGPVMIHHYGARNVDAYLSRLVATFPEVERVLLTGISAGGFGSAFNWWRVQGAFPQARVDVLDDAGLLVEAGDARFTAMVASWKMALPPGCSDCGKTMTAWLPFYASRMTAPRRFALSGFLGDQVIGSYFALDGPTLAKELLALRAAAAANQKTFFLSGSNHSVIGEGASMTATDGSNFGVWFLKFANDDPTWEHAGP